jgi:alpha-tubulin suppressor-like RCC1 family protein
VRGLAVLFGLAALAAGCGAGTTQSPPTLVRAWGDDSLGELGDGPGISSTHFGGTVRVAALDRVTRIAAGGQQSLALRDDGTVWAWGRDGYTANGAYEPAAVAGLTGARAIGAGRYHLLAVLSDGSVWAWGTNDRSQLGHAPFTGGGTVVTTESATPVEATGVGSILAVTGGWGYSLALQSGPPNLTVWGWGRDHADQLGAVPGGARASCGPEPCVLTPAQIPGLTDVIEVAAGWDHALAVKSDGSVWSWGSDYNGQLADPRLTTTTSATPVRAQTAVGPTLIPLASIMDVAAGANHSLALARDGTVWGWGDNHDGQTGAGVPITALTKIQTSAVKVAVPKLVTAIAAGADFSLALADDGTVYAWGLDSSGQLGVWPAPDTCGPPQDPCSLQPIQIPGLAGVTALAAGWGHALAIVKP